MISVIIPVYRGKELLEKAVRSVQSQSCGDWELILVDDGSPDGCGPVCDRLAGADGRIRVFHQENRGVSRARNLGLSKAAGEYVFFLDADDFIAPETLETLLAALEKSGADTAGCGVRYVDEQGREGIAEPPILPAGVYDHPDILERVVDRLAGDRLSQPPLNGYVVRFLFPRRLLEGLEFQGAYLEDELFLMEYFTRPQRLVTVEDAFYHYYWNPNSATHRYMPGYLDTFHAFLAAKEQVIRERGLEERSPLWRENTCWAGLLIAVSNEFAPGNGHTLREQKKRVRELVALPEMAQAMARLRPEGMGRNKQLVADLLRRRWFGLLALLYRAKNRG